eukprot:jgi/Bigna1/128273/aug1.6_g2981
MGRRTRLGKLIAEKSLILNKEFEDQIYLALVYLEEKHKPASNYRAQYFQGYPTERDVFPVFWPESCRKWLRGSSMQASIEGLIECMESEYATLLRACNDGSFARSCSLADYTWARMMVTSRAFRLTIGGKVQRVLSPIADMMDHAEERWTTWQYDEELKALTVVALEDRPAGQEIQCHYGKKSAKSFLLYYGFSPSESLLLNGRGRDRTNLLRNSLRYPHLNDVHFVMFIHPDFPEAKQKQELVNDKYKCKKYAISADFSCKKSLEALSFMRLLQAEGEEELALLPKMGPNYDLEASPIMPLTLCNEIKTLEMLKNLFEEQKSGYVESGSEEDDDSCCGETKEEAEEEREKDGEANSKGQVSKEKRGKQEMTHKKDGEGRDFEEWNRNQLKSGQKRKIHHVQAREEPENRDEEEEKKRRKTKNEEEIIGDRGKKLKLDPKRRPRKEESREGGPEQKGNKLSTLDKGLSRRNCSIIVKGEQIVCDFYISLVNALLPIIKKGVFMERPVDMAGLPGTTATSSYV